MEIRNSLNETNDNPNKIILPAEFSERLQQLEIDMYEGNLNAETLNELFEIYSAASSYYESNGMHNEFNFFVMKMQNLMKNDKIQHILKRRKSKELARRYSMTLEEKKEKVEKIKNLIKENKNNTKEITNQMIENLESQNIKEKAETIIHKEINSQEESFKKRLEEKRSRGNSLPHLKLKSKLGGGNLTSSTKEGIETNPMTQADKQFEISQETNLKIEEKKVAKTPIKRKSIMSTNTFGMTPEEKTINPTLLHFKSAKLQTQSIRKMSTFNQSFLEDITDDGYDNQIEQILTKLWDKSKQSSIQKVEEYESEINDFLNSLYDEKYKKSLEIYSKFDKELKDMQNDVDLSDETNVNTIIYKEIIRDRDSELDNLHLDLEEKRTKTIFQIKQKYQNFESIEDKLREIKIEATNISNYTKDKIKNSSSLRSELDRLRSMSNSLGQNSNYKPINTNNTDDSYDSSEEREVVHNLESRKISEKKTRKESKNSDKIKSPPTQKRVSRGFIGIDPKL